MSRQRFFRRSVFLVLALFLFGCAPDTYPTPLEDAQADRLTSHGDMMAFLEHLHAGTGAFTMDTIGTSQEGRALVLLHFGGIGEANEPSGRKLRVFFFAQQHGNEPSGKEAAIALARDLATGALPEVLDPIDFYLIPQVNPDGSEAEQRQNADGMDLNRDHLTLTTPEVQAVHRVFQEVMPEVVLDIHEYGITSRAWVEQGFRKNFGQQIGALSNANMSMELRTYAWGQVIPSMAEALAARNVQLQRYLVTDGPDERFRYSTTALNDGRNSTGIYNALTFLIEGRNGLTVEDNIRERTRQQLETMKAFLGYLATHSREVKELVEREQARLSGRNPAPEVALVMDYVRDSVRPTVTVGVVDVETEEADTLVIENFHPKVEATLFVDRPAGYVIPPDLRNVVEVLGRHEIPMTPLEEPLRAEVEAYTITGVETSQKEDKDFLAVAVDKETNTMEIPAGHILVRTQGIQTNLVVGLLEPQSQWGLAPLPEFDGLLEVGSRYPILRVIRTLD